MYHSTESGVFGCKEAKSTPGQPGGVGILAEAALSYVGLGAQPPTPSWGRMLADAQTLVSIAPHMALVPGFSIILTVLGLNLLGDGLRDLLDPKLQQVQK